MPIQATEHLNSCGLRHTYRLLGLLKTRLVAADLVTQTNVALSLQQDISKKAPEFNRDDLREIHIHSWRVIYHVQTNRKFVLTLFHKRRDLTSDDILLPQ